MQVSWIEADEIRDLVAQLAEPSSSSGPGAPDLDTLPEGADRFGFAFMTEKLPPLQDPAAGADSMEAAPPVEAAIQPDLDRVRERLRAIRDRAQEAGLLPKETPAERAAATPSPPPPVAQAAATAPPTVAPAPAPPLPPPPPVSVTPVPAPPATAAPPPTPAAQKPLPPVPAPAATAPATQKTASDAEQLTIVQRLDEFARWCSSVTASEELYMFDSHADLIWGCPTNDDLLMCAKLAINACMRSHAATLASPGSDTPMQAGSGKELRLVSCNTIHGSVMIVLVNPRQVPAATLREALALALRV